MRYAVFGDVGGQLEEFKRGLASVGVTGGHIPTDLIVVQVGDLVHKGPDSDGVLELVNHYARAYPKQWVQLLGNHELPYLSKQTFFYREVISPQSQVILTNLYRDGFLHHAFALETHVNPSSRDETHVVPRQFLITHAGLTAPNWNAIGRPSDAFDAARLLNEMELDQLREGGVMIEGVSNSNAGIFWAEGVSEVYASWMTEPTPPPFSQIHGHSSCVKWSKYGNLLRFIYSSWVTDSLTIDAENLRTEWTHNGASFFAIDLDYNSNTPSSMIGPLLC